MPRKKGASAMRDRGYIETPVWLSGSWHAQVTAAARHCGLPRATFIRLVVLAVSGGQKFREDVRYQLDVPMRGVFRDICAALPVLYDS